MIKYGVVFVFRKDARNTQLPVYCNTNTSETPGTNKQYLRV